jgi:hypothetical protein
VKSFWHSLIPVLPFLLNHLGRPSPELDPVLFRLLFCTLLLLLLSCQTCLIITLHGPHGKHRLLLSRMRVYCSVKCRVIAQVVSSWLLTAARFRGRIWSCGICGGQSVAGEGLLRILFLWGVTKSTRYCGHFWPIVQAPDNRWGGLWSNWWNEDCTGRKPEPAPFCPPQIPHNQTRARTRAAAVGSQRLTAWAMARPLRVV